MERNKGQSHDLQRYHWLDLQIRRGCYPNASTMAKHFEISRKAANATIQRLQGDLCAPLSYDQARKGYTYSDSAFRLPPLWLQEPTASSLLVAQDLLSRLLLDSPDPQDQMAAERLFQVAGVAQCLRDRISFETVEHHPPSTEIFSKVLHALAHEQLLELDYDGKANGQKSTRTVEPRLLHNFAGNWYLFAHCRMRQDIRMFALDRMQDVRLLPERYPYPSDFDPQSFVRQAFGVFKTGARQMARIRFSPFISAWVRDQTWHPDQALAFLPDGSLEMLLPFAGEGVDLVREVTKYGPDAEILEPEGLRAEVVARLTTALAKYSS